MNIPGIIARVWVTVIGKIQRDDRLLGKIGSTKT
jgi:hypothetical protein